MYATDYKCFWQTFFIVVSVETRRRKTALATVKSTTTITTVLWPFFWDHPGEPVPEESFWTLWCKERLTEADTPTIRLSATPVTTMLH